MLLAVDERGNNSVTDFALCSILSLCSALQVMTLHHCCLYQTIIHFKIAVQASNVMTDYEIII